MLIIKYHLFLKGKFIHSCKNLTYSFDNDNWKGLGELLLKIYNDLIK